MSTMAVRRSVPCPVLLMLVWCGGFGFSAIGCSRDKNQSLKYTDPARRFDNEWRVYPWRMVFASRAGDPRFARAVALLRVANIQLSTQINMGTENINVDVDEEEKALQMLKRVMEFEDCIPRPYSLPPVR